MARRLSRNDYAPTWEDNEISLRPADDVSPSSYTDSQAADIPMPTVKKDKRPSTASLRTPRSGKRGSESLNSQKFIPLSMRALYYSVEPATSSSTGSTPNGPVSPKPRRFSNPGTQLVLDPNFPTPQPSPQEYLIKVQTAAFCHDEMRLATALNPQKTTPQIPLHSICGTVISTPTQDSERPEGSKFKIGDTVWGVTSYTRDGGAADYAVAAESELALKPTNIGAQEAAALALPGLTAWQALFRYAEIDPDASVNGGNGIEKGKESVAEYGNGQRRGSPWANGNGNGNGNDGNGQNMFRMDIFGENRYDKYKDRVNGHRNGDGNGQKKSIYADGDGNGKGHSWLRKSVNGINNLVRTASTITRGSGSTNGNGNRNGHGNGHEYGYGRRRSTWQKGGGLRRRRGSQMQLRVLITNARDSEVGRIAVQLLRAEKLFTFPERPWICVTCTPMEADIVRGSWDVDEVIVIPNIPEFDECDFGKIFRSQRWSPVDVVLDCSGGVVFQQAHSPSVVKDGGAVLTAVDPWPAQEPATGDPLDNLGRRKRGLKTTFVPVNPDAISLERIVELVESNMVRGRPEQVTDLMHADRLLRDHAVGAGAVRRGVMMVVRVN
ncbi:uncharacterized protein N7473_000739 [Penicillium subrubescens]|uniref:Alcohol dehydrogenase-like N-terminal domain-containing protein n=1 Tax=Penicillium subrubescens TaxID=1316194 RepID=A0A1Q5T0X5_9EURO|nr:uncharacterized protein N7473_000739 [Penicillium subrubescens]KAJ5911436.1 hypothetical protein N7473_000739 [Penicillium subrubescens]OKO93832.1 hypothetical protein PENSUB_12111 [Penicillium subrubescens]